MGWLRRKTAVEAPAPEPTCEALTVACQQWAIIKFRGLRVCRGCADHMVEELHDVERV